MLWYEKSCIELAYHNSLFGFQKMGQLCGLKRCQIWVMTGIGGDPTVILYKYENLN